MNTQLDNKHIDENYDSLVGVLKHLRRYGAQHGIPSTIWSPNFVSHILYTMHSYRQFTSNEIVWLSDNL
jgi:hypothetical protein